MARKTGQIVGRGRHRWLVRVFLGRDRETRRRRYLSRTVHGPVRQAQSYLNKVLRERDLGRRSCAEEAPALSRMFSSTQVRERNPKEESTTAFEALNARMELVTDALALLLVSDELEKAKSILDDPWWILGGHATEKGSKGFGTVTINMRQFVRLCLFSALGGRGRMRATNEAMEFATAYGYLNAPWRREAEREFVSVLPALYSIAIASGSEGETVDFLASLITDAVQNQTHIDLMEQPEFQVLGIYAIPEIARLTGLHAPKGVNPLDGFVAFREMERRYALRVRQMREDTYHWNHLNPAGDLVDWGLLIAEVAALRSSISLFPLDFEVSPEMRFCQELASALADRAG